VAAGDTTSVRLLADMTGRGEGRAADLAGATASLETLVANGDTASLVTLGDLYSQTASGTPDPRKALAYYEQAGDSGNTAGWVRAGNLLRGGLESLAADGAAAARFYQKAAEAGDNAGRRALAALLLEGKAVPADPDAAVQLLDTAASAGDSSASLNLANAYAYGSGGLVPDYDKAAASYKMAEQQGNAFARVRFGVALANGPLSRDHAAEGVALVQSAVDDNITGAAVELAKLEAAGKVEGRGPEDAIPVLAAAAGTDANAARALIRIYRDGTGAMHADLTKARKTLEQATGLLPAATVALESLQIEAKNGFRALPLSGVAERFDALADADAFYMLQRFRTWNANAYVYVLQERLIAQGRLTGNPSGLLGTSTIRALYKLCAEVGATEQCTKGPRTKEAAEVYATVLFKPRAAA
jgi:TPR repeat protein